MDIATLGAARKQKIDGKNSSISFETGKLLQDGLLEQRTNIKLSDAYSDKFRFGDNFAVITVNVLDTNKVRLVTLFKGSADYVGEINIRNNLVQLVTTGNNVEAPIELGLNTICFYTTEHDEIAMIVNNAEYKTTQLTSKYEWFTINKGTPQQTSSVIDLLCIYENKISYSDIQKNTQTIKQVQHIASINSMPIATNSNLATMPDGRTLTQFANNCLNWKTVSGTPYITAANCKPAWVKSAKISGQTVKSILDVPFSYDNTWTKEDDTYLYTHLGDGTTKSIVFQTSQLKIGKTYTIFMEIIENNLETTTENENLFFIRTSTCTGETEYVSCAVGKKQLTFTVTAKDGEYRMGLDIGTITGGTLRVKNIVLVESSNNVTSVDSLIPFGLTPAKAIISANNLQTSFTLNGEVIELNKVGNVVDTLELLEDGSGVFTKKLYRLYFNSVVDKLEKTTGTEPLYYIPKACLPFIQLQAGLPMCTHYEGSVNQRTDKLWLANNYAIAIKDSSKYGATLEEMKEYLRGLNMTVVYPIATSQVTYIPKEQMQTILTQLGTNTFTAGGAVKASALEVTVPYDAIAELQASVAALQASVTDLQTN